MAGMEVLGRLANVIPIAAGAPFKIRGASCHMVVVTGATAVATLAQDSSFGGGFATAAAIVKNIYWTTATNGTAAWSKLTYVNGTAPFAAGPLSTFTLGTTTGLTTAIAAVFHIFTSELADPYNYIKVTMTGGGLCSVFSSDLTPQRAPANLEIMGA
jgi:hypothetical protein